MTKGIGVDIVEIDRLSSVLRKNKKKFLQLVFTDREIKYCKVGRSLKLGQLAARFAAKEAYAKALGVGLAGLGGHGQGLSWKDIEVVKDRLGKPGILYKRKRQTKTHLSLSHGRDYAVAMVYVEK